MTLKGSDIPKPMLTFDECSALPDNVRSMFQDQSFTTPTPIQAQVTNHVVVEYHELCLLTSISSSPSPLSLSLSLSLSLTLSLSLSPPPSPGLAYGTLWQRFCRYSPDWLREDSRSTSMTYLYSTIVTCIVLFIVHVTRYCSHQESAKVI